MPGHVRKRPGARGVRWQARWPAPDGKERVRTFTRKGQAEQWLRAQGAASDAGSWVDPRAGGETVGEFVQRWWPTTVHLRPSARARVASTLRSHVLPRWADVPLRKVDHLEVSAWVAELSTKRSASTTRKAYHALSQILAAAVKARLLTHNPAQDVPLPSMVREEMRFLTAAELEQLAEAAGPDWRAWFLVAGWCGLRFSETAGLQRQHVDVPRRVLHVRGQIVQVNGRLCPQTFEKTKAGRRRVPMPTLVAKAVAEHLLAQQDPNGLVFTSAPGGVLRNQNFRRRVFDPAVARAGVGPLRPHDLRHTAVSLWIDAGVDALEIARRAGHTSPTFTYDWYGHLMPDAAERMADRLDAYLNLPRSNDGRA